MDLSYTPEQLDLIHSPTGSRTFLEGLAGVGKTTAAVGRLRQRLADGLPASSVLILVPHRLLGKPYLQQLRSAETPPGGQVTVLTFGGLAKRMIDLFWPLLAEEAGFAAPQIPPTFLTLETAQYFMAEVIRPLLDQGYFATVTLSRNRLYSQILDNLNKAAVVGFSHHEIGKRLTEAGAGGPGMAVSYEQVQESANRFRSFCYQRNLLDFSLQIEVFHRIAWNQPWCRRYLTDHYRVIFADNIEEDTPVAHQFLQDLVAESAEALLVTDVGGGFRRFLGADPEYASLLKQVCDRQISFRSFQVPSHAVRRLANRLSSRSAGSDQQLGSDVDEALHHSPQRFYPEMLDWTAQAIQRLVSDGVAPGEIVVLAPFMGDALRFALTFRLEMCGVSVYSARPSRSLAQEPAARCLLQLAALSHPEWSMAPSTHELAQALTISIDDLDPTRAQLLAETLYREAGGVNVLRPFASLRPEMKSRITFSLGQRYDRLRTWIEAYRSSQGQPLDHLLSRVFGELLSQSGYGFHADFDAGVAAAQLIRSVQEFRQIAASNLPEGAGAVGSAYIRLAREGVIGMQSLPGPSDPPADAVLLAPAYTFLMNNRAVDYQFWLNIGGRGWSERLYQPLTHPYVLSAQWTPGRRWTDMDEVRVREQILHVLTQGLLRRCRKGVYLGISELGESGTEERSPLLSAVQDLLMERVEPGVDRV